MQGLRTVLSQYDLNGRITPLAETILRTLALNRLQELVNWVMQADKMAVAQLAPCIFEAANIGDPEMLRVVQEEAAILAEFTRAVAQRLDYRDAPVRLLGGLFTHHADYVALYKYRLGILLPDARAEVCARSGALGAAWLATNELQTTPVQSVALPVDRAELASEIPEQSNHRSAQLGRTREIVVCYGRRCRLQSPFGLPRTAHRGDRHCQRSAQPGSRLFHIEAGTSGRLGVLDTTKSRQRSGAPDLVQGIIAGGAPRSIARWKGGRSEAGAWAMLERGVRQGDVVCG
jgi:hypothetical protein